MTNNLTLKHLPFLLSSIFWQAAQAGANIPTSGVIVAGGGTISQSVTTQVTTTSNNTIINWGSFSIGAGQTVNFSQPNATSNVLNRVTGIDPSLIQGTLNSNGRVLLVNPNGITFSAGSTINVGGLIASTLDISNSDFLAGRFSFNGTSTAAVTNDANITVINGNRVVLIGKDVFNTGTINAAGGEVWLLAGGSSMTATEAASPELSITFNAPAGQAVNIGQIIANGGVAGLLGNTVTHTGSVSANSVSTSGGRIFLRANNDLTVNAGARVVANGGIANLESRNGNVKLGDGSLVSAGIVGIKGTSVIQDAGPGTSVSAGQLGVYATAGSIRLAGPNNNFSRLTAQMDSTSGTESMMIVDNAPGGLTFSLFDPTVFNPNKSSSDLPVDGIQAGNNAVKISNSGFIAQTTSPIKAGALTLSSQDAIDLQYSGNNIGTLTANAGGPIRITDGSGGLLLTGATSSSGVGEKGEILIKAIGGDLVLDTGASIKSSGDNSGVRNAAVLLATERNFINNNVTAGAKAITTPNGRWLIYAANPATSVRNGLVGSNLYNCIGTSCAPSSVPTTDNYFLWQSLAPIKPVTTVADQIIRTTFSTLPTTAARIEANRDQDQTTSPKPTVRVIPSNTGNKNVDQNPARNRFMCSA